MANPSLQIGNEKWAIKEDNLLGYSTAGTRFVPEPITMTRASAGTRVNSSGLVETVELLGSEEVVNGDFATDSAWTKSPSGVTISGGSANFNLASDTYIYQDILTEGKTYKITFSGTINSGSFYIGQIGVFNNVFSAGTYTDEVVYLSVSNLLGGYRFIIRKFGAGTLDATIDNVSVKESTKNNLARVDYDGTASSLLVEPERTNLLPYSSDFSQWNVKQAAETLNYGISPDGTQNSTRIVFASSNLQFSNIFTTVTPTTGSIYIKGVNGETITFGLDSSENVFTLNGSWQRFEKSGTSTSNKITINTFSGATARDIEVWGAQVEEGSYATSYIPTDGSTVTRVQDQYSKTGISNLINSEEGVLFAEMAALANDGTYREISLNDGTTNNVVEIRYNPLDNQFQFVIRNGGAVDVAETITLSNALDFNKIAFSYKSNDYKMYVNGVKVATDTSGTMPSGLDTLSLDWGGYGVNPFYGKVKQLQVFKTALTDDELTILTGTSGVHFFPSYAAMASVLTYTIE
jgi:hypothetical protein